ncbi:MAG: isoprenylcysteine carboxylmethyltransferase family protein [Wenzhouxiangellaceae bacterium]|nr:isoprenylcysteine carboxylmethyltransferase family protein [Wenzhouxiangellaceae bacterium]
MKRVLILAFGGAVYTVFFLTFLYLIAFLGNLQATALADALPWLPAVVPVSIDLGRSTGPMALAVAIDLGLILLFGLQHSIMARSGFKARLTRVVPQALERSVYVLASSIVLIVLFWQWRPIPEIVWAADSPLGLWLGWTTFAAGFGIVLVSTFLIDHFDLFGLRQVWAGFRGVEAAPHRFVEPGPYRWVRHPMYVGFLLALWGGPVMSVGHVLFSAGMTAYILIGIRFEERELVRYLGPDYEAYRERTPMLVPGLRRRVRGG